MITRFLPVLCAFLITSPAWLCAHDRHASTMEGMIHRLLPGHEDRFVFESIGSEQGKDVFELESLEDKIVIRGNSPLTQAVGLNWYLKYHCLTSVSWYAHDDVELPKKLPKIKERVRRVSHAPNRFFLNYCTYGYTMPWWGWDEWERLIDWMALNGINMPLAITGQESIWQKVWRDFGLSDEEIRSYFTGPAHLPWHRMANIDRWGGPLPQSYIDAQFELQKRILERERAFEMTPVLPAFAGHVPPALKESQPKADISRFPSWQKFPDANRPAFLDPKDPLFPEIQKRFLEEQTRHFGTNHYYGTDPFNEMIPPSWEPEYLADVARTIYGSIAATDDEAVWIQMAWLFYYQRKDWTPERIDAMLSAVPPGKMLLLDYYGEQQEVWKLSEAFFGQPYIWCYLGNFGGNTYMAGNLQTVEERVTEALFGNESGNITGVGSTLEAIDVNPLMYEFIFEKVWREGAVDLTSWITSYAHRRGGQSDPALEDAWKLLAEHVYTHPSRTTHGSIITARPALSGHSMRWTNPAIAYDNSELLKAWELMLQSETANRDVFMHDLAVVTTQAIANHAHLLRNQMATDFESGDREAFEKSARTFLQAIEDVDRITATRTESLLGKWIEDARSYGSNRAERAAFEHNARNILTTWGQKDSKLTEYANRHWAGLIKSYYLKRWALFIDDLRESLESGEPFDEAAFHEKVTEFEWQWTQQTERHSTRPKGNTLAVSRKLFDRYAPLIREVVADD